MVRGGSFFTLHTRSEYLIWGYETFCPIDLGGAKHFANLILGVRNIFKNIILRGVPNISGQKSGGTKHFYEFCKKSAKIENVIFSKCIIFHEKH